MKPQRNAGNNLTSGRSRNTTQKKTYSDVSTKMQMYSHKGSAHAFPQNMLGMIKTRNGVMQQVSTDRTHYQTYGNYPSQTNPNNVTYFEGNYNMHSYQSGPQSSAETE